MLEIQATQNVQRQATGVQDRAALDQEVLWEEKEE